MSNHILRISATALHGRFDIDHEFTPGVNIIYGKNGSGKTTVIHILANALSGDWTRFVYLDFREIKIHLEDVTLRISREMRDGTEHLVVDPGTSGRPPAWPIPSLRMATEKRAEAREQSRIGKPVLECAYFPAFRTMIEAWTTAIEKEVPHLLYRETMQGRLQSPKGLRAQSTQLARDLFGQFVPDLAFPSPLEIQYMLSGEVRGAALRLAQTDRELLMKAFLEVFMAISTPASDLPEDGVSKSTSEGLLEEIRSLSAQFTDISPTETRRHVRSNYAEQDSDVYQRLRLLVHSIRVQQPAEHVAGPVLKVYRDLLKDRVARQAMFFEGINRYLEAANDFLDDKDIEISLDDSRSQGSINLRFRDGTVLPGLRVLSSGERQVISLIYAATHMSSQKVVLIDEPEISLHVDWQRRLLRRMSEQLEDRQVIAATHSPVIGADYEDRMKELIPRKTKFVRQLELDVATDDEDLI